MSTPLSMTIVRKAVVDYRLYKEIVGKRTRLGPSHYTWTLSAKGGGNGPEIQLAVSAGEALEAIALFDQEIAPLKDKPTTPIRIREYNIYIV